MCSHGAPKSLRRDVEARAREAQALPLDRLMLNELVARGFDDHRVAELAALDDGGRGRRGDDGVVGGARDGLVDTALDDDLRRDDIDGFADGVVDCLHLTSAERAVPERLWDGIRDIHAPEMRGELATSSTSVSAGLLRLRVGGPRLLRVSSDSSHEREQQLALEALEGFGARALAREMRDTLRELEIDVAHAAHEGQDGEYELDEPQPPDHLLEPSAELVEVRDIR